MFFINENYINSLIEDESLKNEDLQRYILLKAADAGGLNLKESASLLNISAPELYDDLLAAAKVVKEKIYGRRIVLFARLYITNVCAYNCRYCAFRNDNSRLKKGSLTLKEIVDESRYIISQGHKIILLITGEHPRKALMPHTGEIISRINKLGVDGHTIRRLDINSAPLSIEEFKVLKSFGIGIYHCFQETYEYGTYLRMHPEEPQRDYAWNLYAMERAIRAGIEDVGIGALFGLTDYRFETLALLSHAFDLDMKYGIGPHIVSTPRLKPAGNAPSAFSPPFAVDDLSFKKLIAVIRLAIPYTGINLSSGESSELRRELLISGISQMSVGGRTSPGNFNESKESLNDYEFEQFRGGDERPLTEVVRDITELTSLPSFCTACRHAKRTGNRFMDLAKSGDIGNRCTPNAFATFKEYLNNFASEDITGSAGTFLKRELNKIDGIAGKKTEQMISKVDAGERDVYL